MQVLTDVQWAKFEAAIAAVKLRGARPRKEDRRTIEAIIWRLDNGAKWRSIPAELGDWHHAYLRFRRWCRVVANAALLHSLWVFLNLCDARSDNTADAGAGQFNAGAAHLLPHWKRVRLRQRAAAMTGPLKGCSRSRRVGCRYSRDADLRQQMPPAGLLMPGGLGMHSAWRGAMTLRSGGKSHRLRKTHLN
jgi:transposase